MNITPEIAVVLFSLVNKRYPNSEGFCVKKDNVVIIRVHVGCSDHLSLENHNNCSVLKLTKKVNFKREQIHLKRVRRRKKCKIGKKIWKYGKSV